MASDAAALPLEPQSALPPADALSLRLDVTSAAAPHRPEPLPPTPVPPRDPAGPVDAAVASVASAGTAPAAPAVVSGSQTFDTIRRVARTPSWRIGWPDATSGGSGPPASRRTPAPDDRLAGYELRRAVRTLGGCMGSLSTGEQRVILLRANLASAAPRTRARVAEILDTSVETVRRIEQRGLADLRRADRTSACGGGAGVLGVGGIATGPVGAAPTAWMLAAARVADLGASAAPSMSVGDGARSPAAALALAGENASVPSPATTPRPAVALAAPRASRRSEAGEIAWWILAAMLALAPLVVAASRSLARAAPPGGWRYRTSARRGRAGTPSLPVPPEPRFPAPPRRETRRRPPRRD
jgi:hypothetical protein